MTTKEESYSRLEESGIHGDLSYSPSTSSYIQLHPATSRYIPDKAHEPKIPMCHHSISSIAKYLPHQPCPPGCFRFRSHSPRNWNHRTHPTHRSIIISASPWPLTGFLTVLEDEVFFPNWLTWERQPLSHLEQIQRYHTALLEPQPRRRDILASTLHHLDFSRAPVSCLACLFRCVAKCDAGSR